MEPALLLLQAAPPAADAYLADFLRTLLALAGVCALSFFVLRWLARRGGLGRLAQGGHGITVLARVPLEARKSLYVVRAGRRLLLLGTGEAGPPALLAELEPDAADPVVGATPAPPDAVAFQPAPRATPAAPDAVAFQPAPGATPAASDAGAFQSAPGATPGPPGGRAEPTPGAAPPASDAAASRGAAADERREGR